MTECQSCNMVIEDVHESFEKVKTDPVKRERILAIIDAPDELEGQTA